MATDPASHAATILKEQLGSHKVILQGDTPPNLGKYGTGFYFTAQARENVPFARILPTTTAEIVTVINTVRETGATFAVKSGGHGTYGSAANAMGGITIDLSRFKEITIADDRKSVFIGGGCRWGEVYRKLEAAGLGVVGGRVSSVGVGGLTTAGGVSFFSSERGLACDNVRSFELVTVSGKVINVTRESEPDLYWAMRGCGINLGIIAGFQLGCFPLGTIWGGAKTFPLDARKSVFAAFSQFILNGADPKAEAFLLATDVAADGNYAFTTITTRSVPEENPAVFESFKRLPCLASSTRIRTLPDLCDEIDEKNEPGFRFHTTSQSMKCDLDLMEEILDIHTEVVKALKGREAFLPELLFQPFVRTMLPKDDMGNTLGIKPEDCPLIIICLLWKWAKLEDDEAVLEAASFFVKKVESATQAREKFHPFQYLPYAAGNQRPYRSYGEENRKKVLDIRKRYDPMDTMPKLRPGIIPL